MFRRNSLLLSVIAALIVTPASAMLALYWLTGDPTLRPLAITAAKLRAAGRMNRPEVRVVIDTGNANAARLKQELEPGLRAAFDMYQIEPVFDYHRSGRDVRVTYFVGVNRIGPYSLHQAPSGIRPAAEAYRMQMAHAGAPGQLPWYRRITAD